MYGFSSLWLLIHTESAWFRGCHLVCSYKYVFPELNLVNDNTLLFFPMLENKYGENVDQWRKWEK